ncbi:MAG TPA: 2'-5' RNA ligase family protein [Acidimicrobiales bacterium]|nr:2'-5' RNA ligase family protein [Acidimicrobiales bacterium]
MSQAGTRRLFLAVWPDAAALAALDALDRPERQGLRWTRRAQWHVTLRFLGQAVPDDVVAALSGWEWPTATTADMGPSTRRLGSGVLAVPVDGLERLAEAVTGLTASIGRPPDRRPFRGHLTLARARHPGLLRGLTGVPAIASWPVGQVTLVSSRTGPGGSAYEVVHTLGVG